MLYFIGYTLPKLAREAHEQETKNLAKMFDILPLNERSVPHLTFKAPFDFEDIKTIADRLREFCSKQKVGDIEIGGYFYWERGTIAWKVETDDISLSFVKNLLKFLKSIPGLSEDNRANRELNLHASVARFLSPEKFEKIRQYLQTVPQPKYKIKLDNISIYHKVNDKWEELEIIPIGK